jgi:hypothetical protein
MPIFGVRVVPPFAVRGVILLSVTLGSLCGVAMIEEENWAFHFAQTGFMQSQLTPLQVKILAIALTIGAGLIPAALIGLWLTCLSQRRAQMAVAAALAGAAELLTSLLVHKVLWSVDGGTDWSDWPLSGFLTNLAIIAAISAGAALLIRWLVRVVLFTTIEQDGTRCRRCGYLLGSPVITTCPECGSAADPSRLAFARLHRVSDWMQRRALVPAGLLCAAMLVQLVITVHFRTLPALRFLGAFPSGGNAVSGLMIPREKPYGVHSSCVASWVPVPDDSLRAVIILYVPDYRSSLPPMRLAMAATPGPTPPPMSGLQGNFGSPEIGCDLSRDLAERIIREGIPPALIQALVAEADLANWQSTPAAVPGWFTTINQTHWIDPTPYFSAN